MPHGDWHRAAISSPHLACASSSAEAEALHGAVALTPQPGHRIAPSARSSPASEGLTPPSSEVALEAKAMDTWQVPQSQQGGGLEAVFSLLACPCSVSTRCHKVQEGQEWAGACKAFMANSPTLSPPPLQKYGDLNLVWP